MIKEKTQKLIQEKFNSLPYVIQEAINSSDWQSKIRKIVKDNNLLLDQGLAIEKETFLMMLGLEDPKNYTQNIKIYANLNNDQAINIAKEVDEKILKEIKKKIIEESEKEVGLEPNPLDDVLGYTKEMEEVLPSIDLKSPEPTKEEDRDQLIDELDKDITIDDSEVEEDPLLIPPKEEVVEENKKEEGWVINQEQGEPWTISEEGNTIDNKKGVEQPKPTQIPITGEEKPSFRTIEMEQRYNTDTLPNLNPLRTLETDKETIGFTQQTYTKPQEKTKNEAKKETENKIPSPPNQKNNSGKDPYRESLK